MTKVSESFISLPGATIKYRNFSLTIDPINLKKGEILGIFGKSGAGKTSYLKILRESFRSEDAYYMSQFDCLLDGITVRQNIELGLACANKPKKFFDNWERDYGDLLKEFEVDCHLDKYPKALSGGQRKRVEIVRTLMMDPKVLLLDEPFTGIGHIFETVATKYLIIRSDSKSSITLCVSHDFNLLSKFSNNILLIDELGIIETIPVSNGSWVPTTIRTANTLGLENILTAAQLAEFTKEISVNNHHPFLGFWQNEACWQDGASGDLKSELLLSIPTSKIISQKSYLKEGKICTSICLSDKSKTSPLILAGEGEVSIKAKNIYLAINQFYYLD